MTPIDVHGSSLTTSSWLSSLYVQDQIPPLDVIAVLEAAKIKYVLVGAHGLGGWTRQPRATQDVDVIVAARQVRKAVRALQEAYPALEAKEFDVVVRLGHAETGTFLIDIIKPVEKVMRAALQNRTEARSGKRAYFVPTLEMALTLKFAPMISLTRTQAKKHFDVGDFINMIEANSNIDEAKLAELGDLVYNGGGKEIVEKVGQVRRGEKLFL
ncbi:MAG: hypothetical protein U0797_02240 [Gemmataceae bacterium]